MKFNTLPRRVAATGAATALATGALVGMTATAAHADPVSVSYTCPTAIGDLPVDLVTDIPNLGLVAAGGPYAAGSAVPANAVPGGVTNHFTISNATKLALDSVGTTNIDFTSFEGALGNSAIPADLPDVANTDLTQNGDTTWSFDADGNNLAFANPAAGTYDVLAPASFDFTATTTLGPVPVTCTADATPGDYGHQIEVVKNASTTKASSNSPVKKGAKAVLKAKVSAPNHKPTGKVLFKDGKKKLGSVKLNKKGVAVLKKKLSKGKHKISMSYKGDGYTNKSSGKTTVKQK